MGLLTLLLLALLLSDAAAAPEDFNLLQIVVAGYADEGLLQFVVGPSKYLTKHSAHIIGRGATHTWQSLVGQLRDYAAQQSRQAQLLLWVLHRNTMLTGDAAEFVQRYQQHRAALVVASANGKPSFSLAMGSAAAFKALLAVHPAPGEEESAWLARAISATSSETQRVVVDSNNKLFLALQDYSNNEAAVVRVGKKYHLSDKHTVPVALWGGDVVVYWFYRLLRDHVAPNINAHHIFVHPSRTLRRGDTLFFELRLANFNDFDVRTQNPAPAYVYDERSTFEQQFPPVSGAMRVGIDYDGRPSEMIDHPYRWGVGEGINKGNEKILVLGIRMMTCFAKRVYRLGYVFENFFWVLDFYNAEVEVLCG